MATVTQGVSVGSLVPHATAVPELIKVDGTNNPVWGQAFDAAADEQLSTERVFLANYGASNPNISIVLDWYSRTAQTSGAAVWGAAIQAITPGDAQSVLTDGFGTEATTTTTVNGTASGLTRTTITITSLDSAAPNDSIIIKLRRIGTNGSDTLTGDAVLLGMTIQYPDV